MNGTAATDAVHQLEERLKATHGGVEEQSAFHIPAHLPTGVPKTVYDEVTAKQYIWVIRRVAWAKPAGLVQEVPALPAARQLTPCSTARYPLPLQARPRPSLVCPPRACRQAAPT